MSIVQPRDAGHLLEHAFAALPTGVAITGPDGRLASANAAFCAIFGVAESRAAGRDVADFLHPDDVAAWRRACGAIAAGDETNVAVRLRIVHLDGSTRHAQLRIGSLDAEGFVIQADDVTETHERERAVARRFARSFERLEERLQSQADLDPLTGLLGRRRFMGDLRAQAARAARYGERAAVVVLDLDGFKQVNDTLGHAAGDEVLRTTASALATNSRSTDVLGRIGGDEFAVLLPHAGREDAEKAAQKLTAAVRTAAAGTGVAASFGIALLGPDAADGEAALAAADAELYAAKRAR